MCIKENADRNYIVRLQITIASRIARGRVLRARPRAGYEIGRSGYRASMFLFFFSNVRDAKRDSTSLTKR